MEEEKLLLFYTIDIFNNESVIKIDKQDLNEVQIQLIIFSI